MTRIFGSFCALALYVGVMFAIATVPSLLNAPADDQLAASDETVTATQ